MDDAKRVGEVAQVAVEVAGAIGRIVLTRPERGNAVTVQSCVELVDALDRLDGDDEVAVILLQAQGRNFCVGADLEEGFQSEGRAWSPQFTAFVERFGLVDGVPRDPGGVVTLRIAALRKPLVVAVQGAAVGAGASMLLPCDIRVIADDARIGFVFAKRGIASESLASWLLPRVVGPTRALDWVLTGRLVPAAEVEAAGLATHVVPREDVLARAEAIAVQIAEGTSRVAAGVARQLIWGMLGEQSPWEAHRIESQVVWQAASGADVAEGVASFLEKRAPQFPLRVPSDYPDYVPPWPGARPM
ncbi:enoyl-CoA hydratase-related protein [Nocardioides dubius]|uniref:Crotonase/enoyl-CoA hydratase family protein n=1 Tax=Nocardioides dubius TaxID=317019 RepID=A0ABP4ELV4_9ACTN